jgi:hypothetical protein
MLFGFPRRDQARLFPALRVDNKQKTADPADCLPPRFTGYVAFTAVGALNAVRIGEHKLSVFKADFVFQLVFSVLVFVPDDPAIFHVVNVLHYALLVKGDFEGFYKSGAVIPQGRPCLFTGPAREVGA